MEAGISQRPSPRPGEPLLQVSGLFLGQEAVHPVRPLLFGTFCSQIPVVLDQVLVPRNGLVARPPQPADFQLIFAVIIFAAIILPMIILPMAYGDYDLKQLWRCLILRADPQPHLN